MNSNAVASAARESKPIAVIGYHGATDYLFPVHCSAWKAKPANNKVKLLSSGKKPLIGSVNYVKKIKETSWYKAFLFFFKLR